MLLSNRNISLGKDGFPNAVGDVVPNVGSPLAGGLLPRGETDIMIKVPFSKIIYQNLDLCVLKSFHSLCSL